MTVDLTPVAQACAAGSRIGLLNANPRFLNRSGRRYQPHRVDRLPPVRRPLPVHVQEAQAVKRSNPAPTSRIQLDLSPHARDRLLRLRDETEAASYSEVIKRALVLYERVHDEQKGGRPIGFLDAKDMVFHEILVLT
jgi:hypothetical protein